ncbi:bifunctional 2-polyprenyl-6-hydroxyphenol methylase/3-demethylubiquinol 3-O-methyltransferase UbiG [Legionella sp. CNM-4043-24]|uniref:bifunctional 2-polyprenyl-6-hydroxyphenol methylase/3-demethylubiquinol 3-O-methyltransferase UbiG n=1 Tax=Legionella sp. CNM-4043-24 TaxID=3421646 RepID=UPI00403AA84F
MTHTTSIDPQEIAKFAQIANEWWDTNGALKTLHDINPARLDFIRQYVDLRDKRVLDVGCGGGILSESMAACGAEVSGIDAEQSVIDCAIAHARETYPAINYQCVSLEDYQAEPFDAITCMEMLEHVPDPALVIEHCVRLLKPGGFLLLSTINRTWMAYATAIVGAEYLLGLLPRQTHDYNKFIKPGELAAQARRFGLDVVGLRGMSYNPLSRSASLQESVAVNYLMSCFKP